MGNERGVSRLIRLNIGKKLLLGFLSYGALTVFIALFALSSLDRLGDINKSVTQRDIPLMEISDKMVETLLAQELYASRSMILKSPDVVSLFWKRSEEFRQLVDQMAVLPDRGSIPLEKLTVLQEEYTKLFDQEMGRLANPASRTRGYGPQMKEKLDDMIRVVKEISLTARRDQINKTRMISEFGNKSFWVIAGFCLAGILLGVLVALVITRHISVPISQLKLSTKEISEGRFDHLPQVQSWDELGDLSKSFQEMAGRLKELEEMYLDANPLTRLPGGVAIEQVLKMKLAEDAPLAFCLADLRNFKAFNDRYGYARGNEVILATGEMVRGAVKDHGKDVDFIGHVGGDDFVFITSPGEYEKICQAIVDTFDQQILKFYDPEDQQRGYIEGKTRLGQVLSFPIMTIAIAVVTNQQRKLKSHIQVGEIAAEMKNFAKSFSQSIYVVDKRRDQPPEGIG
jgi:diguanylate cyclase (GGDEF)-like protein